MTGIGVSREEAEGLRWKRALEATGGAAAKPPIHCLGMIDLAAPPSKTVWKRVEDSLLVLLLAALSLLMYARHSANLKGTDFPDFYSAARMVIEGQGHHLYDVTVQRQFQVRYAGRGGTLYIHPPFETVAYLAVAWLPLRRAFLLWCVINLAFLALAARATVRHVLPGWDWRLLLAGWLMFVPVLLSLLQGQDSVLLLLLTTLAFVALTKHRGFAAGCWLGLALFKFEIVLPLALVISLQKGRSNFVRGFVLVGALLAGLSVALCGWPVFTEYPRFLLHLEEQSFAGVIPSAMANLRGVADYFLHQEHPEVQIAAIAVLSVAALALALSGWKNLSISPDTTVSGQRFNRAFGNTIVFALLVSYHMNPHDLSLLLLPVCGLLHATYTQSCYHNPLRLWITLLAAILLLPPLHLLLLQAHHYQWMGILLVAWFLTEAALLRREANLA